MTPEIAVRQPDGTMKTVALRAGTVKLGRAVDNDLSFPNDNGLSRYHLIFERDGRDWQVRDLGSKNGTLVNSIRITSPVKLEPGDRISAGHLVISFSEPAPSISNETVVFVDSGDASGPSSTVITSLDGLFARQPSRASSISSGAAVTPAPSEGMHAQALAIASRELAVDRPLAELFGVILDQSMLAVGASRGILMTVEGTELQVREARGENFRISSAVRDRVLREKHSLLVRDTQLDEAFRAQQSIVDNRVRSFMAVPLQTSDKVIGLIYLDSSLLREFTREDLNLITVMSNIAAIRIENARLAEVERQEQLTKRDLEQAADIQRRLLPSQPPRVAGWDLAGYNAPCRTVGGDYFDFQVYPDGRVALIVADVAGKGMPAAMLMSSLQARVQVLSEEPGDLAAMVTRLNRTITANCPANRFITFFIAVLDPVTGQVEYVNAGHNPAVIARADGSTVMLSGGGMILGILARATYSSETVSLLPGDALVLYSDGVTEAAKGDEEFGEERLAQFVAANRTLRAADLISAVNEAVHAFNDGAPAADDVTLVIARRLAEPPSA